MGKGIGTMKLGLDTKESQRNARGNGSAKVFARE
jgi:hypothetical protein